MLSAVDSKAGGSAILATEPVKPRGESVSHSGIKLHFCGFVILQPRKGNGRGLCDQIQIVLIRGQLWTVPRVRHAIFELRRRAKDFPPQGFRFEQVAKRVVRLVSLQALSIDDGSIRIE